MKLADLVILHNAAIGTMNAADEAVRYLESALIKARAAHAAAVKNEAAIGAAVTAADKIERGVP